MNSHFKLRVLANRILSKVNKILFCLPIPTGVLFILRGRITPFLSRVQYGLKNNLSHAVLGNLRRNVHRLEKGLAHLDPKPLFALDYIGETVELFREFSFLGSRIQDTETLVWARDVLARYFTVVAKHETIQCAQTKYEQICREVTDWGRVDSPWGTIPYGGERRLPLSVSYEKMLELAVRRRSIRHYQDKMVPVDDLRKAVGIAGLSPSACNRQPFHFYFFSNPDTIADLIDIPGGMDDFDRRDQIPCIGVLTVDYDNYFHERDLLSPVMDAGMAAMAFQFALETLGLSSVSVNWPILPNRYRKISKLIELKKSETPVLFFAIGYPASDALIPASCKKSVEDLMSYDGETGL